MIYSALDIKTLVEEQECAEDCYKLCGNIENEATLTHVGDDVILRFFHFNLADLPEYVGDSPQRVYLYAQTVVIDRNLVDIPYALQIRARQVSMPLYQSGTMTMTMTIFYLTIDIQIEIIMYNSLENQIINWSGDCY